MRPGKNFFKKPRFGKNRGSKTWGPQVGRKSPPSLMTLEVNPSQGPRDNAEDNQFHQPNFAQNLDNFEPKMSVGFQHQKENGDCIERNTGEEKDSVEDGPLFSQDYVILDWYNSDLNLELDRSTFCFGSPMSQKGFGLMWAGARATYGAVEGRFCYEVKIEGNNPIEHLVNEAHPNLLRCGWSIDESSLQLGEEGFSYGYDGSGKIMVSNKFQTYGQPFSVGDVIGCYLDLTSDPVNMSYTLNGEFLGLAFSIKQSQLAGRALFPHICSKNQAFHVNFGQMNQPYMPILSGYSPIGQVEISDGLQRGALPPPSRLECEVLMMVGLPGSGKTFFADDYKLNHPEKRFNILGNSALLDRMKIMGASRKEGINFKRYSLTQQCAEIFQVLIKIASTRRRNYIIDQSNIFPTARERKLADFVGFRKKAFVVVPTNDIYLQRVAMKESKEGKDVPDSAVMNMKANFVLPEAVEDYFEEVIYTELGPREAYRLIESYNREAWSLGSKMSKNVQNFVYRSVQFRERAGLTEPIGKILNDVGFRKPENMSILNSHGSNDIINVSDRQKRDQSFYYENMRPFQSRNQRGKKNFNQFSSRKRYSPISTNLNNDDDSEIEIIEETSSSSKPSFRRQDYRDRSPIRKDPENFETRAYYLNKSWDYDRSRRNEREDEMINMGKNLCDFKGLTDQFQRSEPLHTGQNIGFTGVSGSNEDSKKDFDRYERGYSTGKFEGFGAKFPDPVPTGGRNENVNKDKFRDDNYSTVQMKDNSYMYREERASNYLRQNETMGINISNPRSQEGVWADDNRNYGGLDNFSDGRRNYKDYYPRDSHGNNWRGSGIGSYESGNFDRPTVEPYFMKDRPMPGRSATKVGSDSHLDFSSERSYRDNFYGKQLEDGIAPHSSRYSGANYSANAPGRNERGDHIGKQKAPNLNVPPPPVMKPVSSSGLKIPAPPKISYMPYEAQVSYDSVPPPLIGDFLKKSSSNPMPVPPPIGNSSRNMAQGGRNYSSVMKYLDDFQGKIGSS